MSGHENTIFCLFFSSPSSDAEAKNSHQIFSLLNHRRRQGEKFFSRRGRGGRKSKKKGGKRGKKSALNNKVRNRFFHVTQFTRDEKKKWLWMAYIRRWVREWEKPPKRKWSMSGRAETSALDTRKNFYHFPSTNNNNLMKLNQLQMSFSALALVPAPSSALTRECVDVGWCQTSFHPDFASFSSSSFVLPPCYPTTRVAENFFSSSCSHSLSRVSRFFRSYISQYDWY